MAKTHQPYLGSFILDFINERLHTSSTTMNLRKHLDAGLIRSRKGVLFPEVVVASSIPIYQIGDAVSECCVMHDFVILTNNDDNPDAVVVGFVLYGQVPIRLQP